MWTPRSRLGFVWYVHNISMNWMMSYVFIAFIFVLISCTLANVMQSINPHQSAGKNSFLCPCWLNSRLLTHQVTHSESQHSGRPRKITKSGVWSQQAWEYFKLKRHFSMEVALRAALVHMADVRWSECEESGCTIQHEMGPLFSCDSHWFYSFPTTHFVFNHQVRMKSTEVPWHGKRQRDLSESDWAQVSVDCMIPSDPRSGSSRAVLVEFVRGLVMLWLMSVFSQRQCQSCLQCCLFVNTVVLTKIQKKQTNDSLSTWSSHWIPTLDENITTCDHPL